MMYSDCQACGFKCAKVCPVGIATGKFLLPGFLKQVLNGDAAVSWPCTGCKSCEAVCKGEFSPRQLVMRARQAFLRHNENQLSDYYSEYVDNGRLGASTVSLDKLEFLGSHAPVACMNEWDEFIVFPGCLVSARYPEQALLLVQLLESLGADPNRIAVEDASCCGSYLLQVDDEEFRNNTGYVLSRMFKEMPARRGKTLLVSICGSCVSSLREGMAMQGALPACKGRTIEVMHYTELVAMPAVRDAIVSMLEPFDPPSRKVYFQLPCQVAREVADAKRIKNGMHDLLSRAGMTPVEPAKDLGCCGAYLLDSHPDFAIEYGIKRVDNIASSGATRVILSCGNCNRMYSEYKDSIAIEGDVVPVYESLFLLDLLVDRIRHRSGAARG